MPLDSVGTCFSHIASFRIKIMSESRFSLDDLRTRTYRDLQQLAKSLYLPSNVKKVHLVELIYAKKFKTPAEVDAIVHQVKLERQNLSQVRKRATRRSLHLQGNEITSTSGDCSPISPPIVATPKRPGQVVIHCSPDIRHTLAKYPRQGVLRSTYVKKTYASPKTASGSDRVLRSFNLRQRPRTFNCNSELLDAIKAQNCMRPRPAITQRYAGPSKEARINIVSQDGVNVMAKCLVQKRPLLENHMRSLLLREPKGQLVQVQNRLNLVSPSTKRPRVPSGIFPIATKESAPKVSYKYIQSIGFRRSDGKMSKINALVQKTLNSDAHTQTTNYRNIELTVQDLINSNIDAQNINTDCPDLNLPHNLYPNMSSLADIAQNTKQMNYFDLSERNCEYYKDNENCDQSSVYYHKKIRGEQVRSQRMGLQREDGGEEESLPRINEVFSRFKDGNDPTQPIYVQVSEESERVFNYPIYVAKSNATNTNALESLYNFKNQFISSQPLLQIATTSTTKCVFTSPVLATAVAHTSTVAANEAYNVSSYERESQYSTEPEYPRVYDFCTLADQEITSKRDFRNDEVSDFSTSASSLDRSSSQLLGSSATIPEMVEDALEIISQDGDYMERIGMDVRMQCILCNWAGPRIILEYHIRKDHQSQVHRPNKSSWHCRFSLGGLVQQELWLSQVVEHQAVLYVVSAKFEEPDCFMASLSILSSESVQKVATITIYNKVTGEPHTWTGDIQTLPPSLPYYTDQSCLKLELSSLNLLPNSANIKLVNKELVMKSPCKVVVGHPELDDIHIVVYVKIID